MFSLLQKKEENHDLPFSQNLAESEAKIVLDEQGTIVFASGAFIELAKLSRDTISKHNFKTLLKFEQPVDKPTNVKTGTHKIRLNANIIGQRFHFDWIEVPGNNQKRKFLVATLEKEDTQPLTLEDETAPSNEGVTTSAPVDTYNDINIFLNLSREMMVVTDTNDKILRANTKFTNAVKYSPTELDNLKFIDLFEKEDQNKIKNENECEARLLSQNGETFWIEWQKTVQNNFTYYSGRNVTDIKKQEKALQYREKQLSQAEILGRMGHWRWVLGEDSIEWSEEVYRIFGVDQGNFETTLSNMNEMVHPDDIDRVNQALQRAIIEENDYDVEFSIRRPDGQERLLRSEGRCHRNEEGEVIALFGIMQDMTERLAYERELKTAKDTAERAYAAKTQFLANMSHELRTPLNAIIGFSEMMQGQLLGPIGNEKYLEYIGGIHESGKHLLDLISDILNMSKIEAGKYDLALEELNIGQIIQTAIKMIENRANDAKVKIISDANDINGLKIIADRRGILQILLNLLSNAVKFSNEGGKIELSCKKAEDGITLVVQDDGIGIPANKLATITNPFEQVSSSYSRNHEGSGLGLAITKELIKLHHGSLDIESKIDVGTTVTVHLPYEPAEKLEREDQPIPLNNEST